MRLARLAEVQIVAGARLVRFHVDRPLEGVASDPGELIVAGWAIGKSGGLRSASGESTAVVLSQGAEYQPTPTNSDAGSI